MICVECQIPISSDHLHAYYPCGIEVDYCCQGCSEDGDGEHIGQCKECREGDSKHIIYHDVSMEFK